MLVLNETPFAVERIVTMNKLGAETLALVAKATYDISSGEGNDITLASEQIPIQVADEFYGEPGNSSVRYEGDLSLQKVGTDLILHGQAFSNTKGSNQVDVTLAAGKVRKTVRVFGDRVWEKILGKYRVPTPAPFATMPLQYEFAFGGVDSGVEKEGCHHQNPVGIGFLGRNSRTSIQGTRLPNLENPQALISEPGDHPEPASFGVVAKSWEPRKALAGTYDDKWMKGRMPLLPDDFDDRFNNGASAGLVAQEYFMGGEAVEIYNVTPAGKLQFAMPKEIVVASMLVDARMVREQMKLDTVIIDAINSKLMCVWRAVWDVHRLIEDIRWVRVQRMESGK